MEGHPDVTGEQEAKPQIVWDIAANQAAKAGYA
jgi:hypothetical protein